MTSIHPERDYLGFLREGRFMIQRARESGQYVFYPRVAAPRSGEALEWTEASGRGVVYATTTIHQRPPGESYNVALIDLQEGPRMLSRVDGIAPREVQIGMAVRALILQDGDVPLVVFIPDLDVGP